MIAEKTAFTRAQELETMYNAVGYSLMSDDFACKLAACCLVLAPYDAEISTHDGVIVGLGFASKKLGIMGYGNPNLELLPVWQKYLKELREKQGACEWLQEIADRYDLKVGNFYPIGKEPTIKKKKK